MPVLLTIVLFFGTFFGWILPSVESQLMDRKREMIHALTQSAWSTIAYYAQMAEKSALTVDEAKTRASEHLRNLRYGPEGKDYFWINDMHPKIVMHPYRPELLRDACEGVNRVKRIVGDLKGFAGIHPSKEWGDVNLNSVVEKSVGLVGSLIKKATAAFQESYASDLPSISGNAQQG